MDFKLSSILFVILTIFAVPAGMVFAQIGGMTGSGANLSITSIGVAIANAVWVVFTIIAVIAFVVAGIMFLTAFGEPEKLSKARSAFIWGVVGIIVALLAFGIITLIRTAIGA